MSQFGINKAWYRDLKYKKSKLETKEEKDEKNKVHRGSQ